MRSLLAPRDATGPAAGALILATLLIGGGLLYQSIVSGSSEQLVTAMLIDAVMVVGLQVYIGNSGVLSFGHIGFGAIAGEATLSASGNLTEAAARLFDMLHAADQTDADGIAVAPIPAEGLGLAINDRLARAAAPR